MKTHQDPQECYAIGQYNLISDALGVDRSADAPGSTTYEAVCILLMKLERACEYLRDADGKEAARTLEYINLPHDSDEFCVVTMFGPIPPP